MQTFDDNTAPYQLPFEAYGVEMRVCTNERELLAEIEPTLPPGWRRRPRSDTQSRLGLLAEGDDIYSLYRYDGACIHDAPGRELALVMMDSQINGHVALEAPNYVFIHAGVVADSGRAILIPGLSFSGKTTLVRALVEAGAIYYSDEFAVLDESGLVHPYPKRLSVRPRLVGDSTTVEEPAIGYHVEQLGGAAGAKPLPLGMVIATRYRAGAEWDPREFSGGAQVLTLLEHAISAQSRPEQTLRYITKAIGGAVTLAGERGDADEFAPLVLDTLRAVA